MGKNSRLLLWEFGRDDPTVLLRGESVFCVAFSPDGKWLAGGLAGVIALWDVSGQNVSWGESNPFKGVLGNRGGDAYTAGDIAFSPDGTTLASSAGGGDNTIRLWDVETRQLQTVLEGHTDGVTSVAFSPDGSTLASGSLDKTIRLWDMGSD